jgi:hypothetical protein
MTDLPDTLFSGDRASKQPFDHVQTTGGTASYNFEVRVGSLAQLNAPTVGVSDTPTSAGLYQFNMTMTLDSRFHGRDTS